MYQIYPMSATYAKDIFTWKYPGEYALYNNEETKEALDEFLNGRYYVCLRDQEIVGFFAFGPSARIPAIEEDAYEEGPLDIGLAMRPDLCGRGYGSDFLSLGISFAREQWNPQSFRLTVAQFNQRAIKAYTKVGFRKVKELNHKMVDMKFDVMLRQS